VRLALRNAASVAGLLVTTEAMVAEKLEKKTPLRCPRAVAWTLRRVAEYGDGWIGFNLLPDEAAEKIKRIEELLKANGRKRSDVKLAVSPYTNPIKTDNLKRYRDAGVEEIALLGSGRARMVDRRA